MKNDQDIVDVQPVDEARARSLRTVGWISYLLHLVVAVAAVLPGTQPSIALLAVALVIDLVKRSDAAGTWQDSHFSWRIRTVVWAAFWYVVTWPLWLLLLVPGMAAWFVISIWFLYRIVKGMVRLNDNRPLDA
ncbi:MAG: hypothetical protein EP306_03855 [Burkholderiales bacterium]|nr:MAG: hypothetical protein EP306_03855 [Burkholderiales bacterium]